MLINKLSLWSMSRYSITSRVCYVHEMKQDCTIYGDGFSFTLHWKTNFQSSWLQWNRIVVFRFSSFDYKLWDAQTYHTFETLEQRSTKYLANFAWIGVYVATFTMLIEIWDTFPSRNIKILVLDRQQYLRITDVMSVVLGDARCVQGSVKSFNISHHLVWWWKRYTTW